MRQKKEKKRRTLWICLAVIAVLGIAGVWFARSPAFIRLTFGISDTLRDRGLKTPEDIIRRDNLQYGTDPMQVMDVYYPAGTTEPLPTIVSIHGGGYTYGSKEVYQYYCMSLAQRGFTVVNFSYRLAPQHKYPAPLEDTNAVMTYVCAHAEELFINPEQIFLVGDSAGGQLNAQYSTAVSNPEYAQKLGLEIPAFRLRGTALNCGVFETKDLASEAYYFEKKEDLEKLDLNPYLTDAFPPAFVMSSTGDMCLPFAEPFYQKLLQLGVQAELHIYGDERNRPPHVFHINIRNETANRCNEEETAFFQRLIAEE